MIDRDSPVTEDELHAYVDGELAGRAARRGRGVARGASRRRGRGRRLAQPGRTDPRALRRRRRSSRAAAASVSPGSRAAGRRGVAWRSRPRPRWPSSPAASPAGLRAAPRLPAPSDLTRLPPSARCLPALRRRGSPSGRSAGRRAAASGAVAVEARRLAGAHPELEKMGLKLVGGRLSAGPDRADGVLHV